MKVERLELPDVLFVESPVYQDARGWFIELWNQSRLQGTGLPTEFVQDNMAYSRRGTLRGLHFQLPHPQGKLVAAVHGEIFDVAVDLRPDSQTFGRWCGRTLKGGSGQALYIPEGFAHGYQVISETAHVLYKCTAVFHPESDRALAWDDPDVGVAWPIADPILSDKDRTAPRLAALHDTLRAAGR